MLLIKKYPLNSLEIDKAKYFKEGQRRPPKRLKRAKHANSLNAFTCWNFYYLSRERVKT
jgi:hypothetical protein